MIQRLPTVADDLIRFDEFCVLVADGEKADLIDGVIYRASPDSRIHIGLKGFIFRLISDFMDAQDIDGFAFFSRFACKITDLRSPEPDVGYVRPEHSDRVHDKYMVGGPDIAVEIVSRDSRQRDYGDKRQLYEEAGVDEYWIIDPIQQLAEFLGLREGTYDLLPLKDNRIFQSAVLPGFWLDVRWLFSKPLPKPANCLRQILASKTKSKGRRKK